MRRSGVVGGVSLSGMDMTPRSSAVRAPQEAAGPARRGVPAGIGRTGGRNPSGAARAH